MFCNGVWSRVRQADLRFPSRDQEALFKWSLQETLHTTGWAFSIAVFLGACVSHAPGFDKNASFSFPMDDPRKFRSCMALVAFLVIPFLVFLFLFLSRWIHCLKTLVDWELILTFEATLICGITPVKGGWVAARLYGDDPMSAFVSDIRGADATVALVVDAIITGICLAVPIRMHLKWIPVLFGVTSYSFCTIVIGSPFPATATVFMIFALALFALWGAWVNEGVARQRFVAETRVRKTSRELEIQTAEKTAFEILLSMVCDAIMWLSEDGYTVLKCDERFDMLVGSPMKGKLLSSCLKPEELERVVNALTAASDIPVMVPTTIHPTSSESHISVDFLIVRQASEKNPNDECSSERRGFLIGLRISSLHPIAMESDGLDYDKMEVLEMFEGIEAAKTKTENAADNVDRAVELASVGHSHIESYETTSTGRVFKNVMSNREDVLDDEIEEKRRFSEISKLGRREGWLVEAEDVRLRPQEILGAGTFGMVIAASLHGTRVAVKMPKKLDDRLLAKHVAAFANELRILRHVRHPNIVLFFGACIDAPSAEICLIFEHIHGTKLSQYIKELQEGSQVHIRWRLVLDIACALRYLHASKPRIVHGDLKDGNIFVAFHGLCAKLLDFGLARVLTKGVQPVSGSLHWAAPEVILMPKVLPRASSDVFSFGRVVYMVFSGRRPLDVFKRDAIVEMAKVGQTLPMLWPERMPLKQYCFDLCQKTSSVDQGLRPTMEELHAEVSGWTHAELDSIPDSDSASLPLKRTGASQAVDVREEVAPCGFRNAIPSSLDDFGSSQTQDSSSLALPKLQPTQIASKKIMLTMQAMQWNFPIPRGCCCMWHAALRDMHSVVRELWDRPCHAAFVPHTQYQCMSCGVVDFQNRCIVCGDQAMSTSVMHKPSTTRSVKHAPQTSRSLSL